MIKFQFLFLLVITLQFRSSCQIPEFKNLYDSIANINLPIKINNFSDFESDSENDIVLYNNLITVGKGYIDHNGRYHKEIGKYSTDTIIRLYEKYNNGKYEKYEVKETKSVKLIGKVNISEKFDCILVKIENISGSQKGYYYQLLIFNDKGENLSAIRIFEQIDDASLLDWMEERSPPNVTAVIYEDGLIEINWDEGYDECYTQMVRLNSEGIFYVEKLLRRVPCSSEPVDITGK